MPDAMTDQSNRLDTRNDLRLADRIRDALSGLRYGSVEIVVHDGRIVQIERRERVRFERTESNPGASQ